MSIAAAPSMQNSEALVSSAAIVAAPWDWRRGLALAAVSALIGLTQSLGVYLINNNLTGIQGALGATAAESTWLTSAYFATNLSATVLLTKMRIQFGLTRFAQWGIVAFLVASAVNLSAHTLPSAIAARAALGLAAMPLTALSFLYMVEAAPPERKALGIMLGIATQQFGSPLSRILSGSLLQIGSLQCLEVLNVALACACLAATIAVRLTPPPPIKVFNPGDVFAFLLYACGFALICIFFTQARLNWWTDTAWLGVCLASGLGSLGLYVLYDLQRQRPLLDLRWICSPSMIRLIVVILLFRLVLSEQPVGTVTFMNALGFNNDQMHVLFAWSCLGTAAGFGISVSALPSMSLRLPAFIALLLIGIAAALDANASSLTVPADLYVSQTLLAAGTAMFLMSSLLVGFIPVIMDGMKNVVSFLAVFSATQTLGNLMGSAWLSTFVVDHQKLHFARLVQPMVLANPQVAARILQGTRTYGGSIADPAMRGVHGVSALAQQAIRESFVLAYVDLFHLIALLAAITFVGLVVIKTRLVMLEIEVRRSTAELEKNRTARDEIPAMT